jgi:shikimate dehydrogenase
MNDKRAIRLGLVGDNIALSESPALHRFSGQQFGVDVTYDLLVPRNRKQSCENILDACKANGYHGLNITYPYKKLVSEKVQVPDPIVRAMGAVNTVIFTPDRMLGFNTDYSGFKAAYSAARGIHKPGIVTMVGAGGVGRALAFGLADLNAAVIRLIDRDDEQAHALATAVMTANPDITVEIWDDIGAAMVGANGLINATPVGMNGYPGSVFDPAMIAEADWAFDAVYTPRDTEFLTNAAAAGLDIISGWELFFFQGVDAWKLFYGQEVDQSKLRSVLQQTGM